MDGSGWKWTRVDKSGWKSRLLLVFDRQLSSSLVDFELVQTLMRVDESLCAFDQLELNSVYPNIGAKLIVYGEYMLCCIFQRK